MQRAIRRRRLRKGSALDRRRAHVRRLETLGKLRMQWARPSYLPSTKEGFMSRELRKVEKALFGRVDFAYAGFKPGGVGAVFIVVDGWAIPHVELDLKFRNRREFKKEVADAVKQMRELLKVPSWEKLRSAPQNVSIHSHEDGAAARTRTADLLITKHRQSVDVSRT
ncbi:MAG: hypothetical protein ACK5XM_07905 [Betaproteobacteria bacterium]